MVLAGERTIENLVTNFTKWTYFSNVSNSVSQTKNLMKFLLDMSCCVFALQKGALWLVQQCKNISVR